MADDFLDAWLRLGKAEQNLRRLEVTALAHVLKCGQGDGAGNSLAIRLDIEQHAAAIKPRPRTGIRLCFGRHALQFLPAADAASCWTKPRRVLV
jgi:hypothetical protein